MLLPFAQCPFDNPVNNNALSKLKNLSSRLQEKDRLRGCSDFGAWLTAPRKRKSRTPKQEEVKQHKDKGHSKSAKNDIYYKRYRIDPLEGTFKHHANHSQYIKLYRETTTLCYKQRQLQELSSLYSAALDVHSDKGQSITGCYNLDPEIYARSWGGGSIPEHNEMYVKEHCINIPPLSTRSEGSVPLMLIPSAPSIPRLNQAAFMCNAYLNKNTVCPVHRLIHRRNVILNSRMNTLNTTMEHIKVELPGIPKRRYNIQLKRLKVMRETHPILGTDMDNSGGKTRDAEIIFAAPTNPKDTTAVLNLTFDEDEDTDMRMNNILCSHDPINPSDKIIKALSQNRRVPNMQLPITALLQYAHNQQGSTNRSTRLKKPPKKRLISQKNTKSKVLSVENSKSFNKLDSKQVNYEKQYEQFFSDILESKGKASQQKHYQNLSNKS